MDVTVAPPAEHSLDAAQVRKTTLSECLLCRSLPTCDTNCTAIGACKGLLLQSISTPNPAVGIGISFSLNGMNAYGGSITFKLVNSINVGEVVRESYHVPVTVELGWEQQSCIPSPPVLSSDPLLTSPPKLKAWEQTRNVIGDVQSLQQE